MKELAVDFVYTSIKDLNLLSIISIEFLSSSSSGGILDWLLMLMD